MPQDRAQEAHYRSADLWSMETGLFSDCVVTCGSKTWKLHRVILVARSEWFRASLAGRFQEAHQATANVNEQDQDAVEVCLKYIYGGVAVIDMAKEAEKRGHPPIQFCAEVYRAADFFMLEPLCRLVERVLGTYLDGKIKWLFTYETPMQDFHGLRKAREWVEDLAHAIFEVERWNTPVMTNMLKEFVWAGWIYFCDREKHVPHINLREWLDEHMPEYHNSVRSLCDTENPRWRTNSTGPSPDVLVWTPKPSMYAADDLNHDLCCSCANLIIAGGGMILQDPFNTTSTGEYTRAWCANCVEENEYPWRVRHYL